MKFWSLRLPPLYLLLFRHELTSGEIVRNWRTPKLCIIIIADRCMYNLTENGTVDSRYECSNHYRHLIGKSYLTHHSALALLLTALLYYLPFAKHSSLMSGFLPCSAEGKQVSLLKQCYRYVRVVGYWDFHRTSLQFIIIPSPSLINSFVSFTIQYKYAVSMFSTEMVKTKKHNYKHSPYSVNIKVVILTGKNWCSYFGCDHFYIQSFQSDWIY